MKYMVTSQPQRLVVVLQRLVRDLARTPSGGLLAGRTVTNISCVADFPPGSVAVTVTVVPSQARRRQGYHGLRQLHRHYRHLSADTALYVSRSPLTSVK